MTLSEELSWRGFVNQTTLKDITALDKAPLTFYWGVDPSADSMQIGNLAAAMMVRHFIDYGHQAVLLVGGATGLIGDPDGKSQERELQTEEQVASNKAKIIVQYRTIFAGQSFKVVDNYDWFKGMTYLQFLRDIGKHVPMRQMLGRDFVQSRLGEDGSGISYAEFSYSLIQGYDFLHLNREHDVSLQVCGADQWGNSIAGVDLIRRVSGNEAHVWSTPLIIDKSTGVKFGKSEAGAVWLDPAKTTPTQFYQFWINSDDAAVEEYLKIYTLLPKEEIESLMATHRTGPEKRLAQTKLAQEVTALVHGKANARIAEGVTLIITDKKPLDEAEDSVMQELYSQIQRLVIPMQAITAKHPEASIIDGLNMTLLTESKSEARRLLAQGAVYVNGKKTDKEFFEASDFRNGRLLLRRGKAFKDSALIELG